MLALIAVGVLEGVITSISPCLLPVLTVVLAAGGGRGPAHAKRARSGRADWWSSVWSGWTKTFADPRLCAAVHTGADEGGVLDVFRPISEQFGLGVTEQEQYFDLFRGNLFASIRGLCRDDAHAEEVKPAFLTRLREDYTPPLVPGMVDVVRRLAAECTLAVMSSNAMQVLRRVLVEGNLAFCFAHVFGGDVMPDKRAAIRAFLADTGSGFGRRCAADYDETGRRTDPDPATTVLVTDTAGDVRGRRTLPTAPDRARLLRVRAATETWWRPGSRVAAVPRTEPVDPRYRPHRAALDVMG